MKKNTGNKIRLGIFVSISVLLFTVGIYFVGERQQLFSSTFHVLGIFTDISGLQVGNNVRFSGINVGIIEDIQQVTDSTVKIDMVIDENTRRFMKKNAKAVIGSDGLMGNKIILIIPGKEIAPELVNNDTIETFQPVTMDDILVKIKVTSENAASISTDLAVVMDNIRSGRGTIGKLLMDSSMAQNVNDAMVNIKQGSGGFKKNMDAASHNFLLRPFLKKKEDEKENKEKEKKNEKTNGKEKKQNGSSDQK